MTSPSPAPRDNARPPALIALDWGTTALRAWLLAGPGQVLQERRSDHGIMHLPVGGFSEAFESIGAEWLAAWPRLPVIACGMVGSAQGWREVPYVRTPADTTALVAGLTACEVPGGRTLHIVPGVLDDGPLPDVMRGEETQIVGASADRSTAASGRALFVLPGTHSKWVATEAGRIVEFRTFMTGDMYAALRGHTILGRLMSDAPQRDGAAFALGVRTGREQHAKGGLLASVFSARSLGLVGRLPKDSLADYLSGLLIGAELEGALRLFGAAGADGAREIDIVGSETLSARYVEAFAAAGIGRAALHPQASPAGLWHIAAHAGLVAP